MLSRIKIITLLVVLAIALSAYFFIFSSYDLEKFLSREVNILNEFNLGFLKFGHEAKFSYIEKINEGKKMLESSQPLKYASNGSGISSKQIAFAVLNTDTGEVFEKRAWLDQVQAENYSQTGLVRLVMDDDGEDISIQPNWFNSFNSDYKIENHPEMAVVANKYLMPSSGLPSILRSKSSFTDIVYVPYSGGVHNEEVISAGREYINSKASEAVSQLNSLGVLSRSKLNRLVTEAISNDLIKNIMLVEHIDPDMFNSSDKERKIELIERVLVIIGSNGERAYNFTGSPAGANGLAQFIKPTYDGIVRLYPKAQLIKDYREGMVNHVNAIKAMVLLFDRETENLKSTISRKDLIDALGISEEMLAAAYNGGPSRVSRSVNTYGLSWIYQHFNSPELASIFRQETVDYVRKFQFIRDLKIFN